jgi:hypothetical protein
LQILSSPNCVKMKYPIIVIEKILMKKQKLLGNIFY